MSRSAYYLTLTGDVKSRYDQKIEVIGDVDPYSLPASECVFDITKLPNIVMMYLVNYLILTHSFYTGQQLKAYKSLQAYKHYEAGSILKIMAKEINEHFVVLCKVRHSQRFREKPLEVWIILLGDGSISSAHCSCMAGLGEVCSHVAAALFCLHARPNTVDEMQDIPCTSQLAAWPVPPSRNVDMVRVREMDWSQDKKSSLSETRAPGLQDEVEFLKKLESLGVASGVFRLIEPFATKIAEARPKEVPEGLDSWYNPEYSDKSYEELLSMAKEIHIAVDEQQIFQIEKLTREQYQSSLWYKFRAGRITASNFKNVCRTSVAKPSLTVIKSICHPQKVNFKSKATTYGLKHEKMALKSYRDTASAQHGKLKVDSCGFVISKTNPEFGASPDGLVSCECCGSGCVEVKCPYSLDSDMTLEEYAIKKHSCLILKNDSLSLSKSHSYYYQVQLQMFVTNRNYCDFVIWSKSRLYIERIFFDNQFCVDNISKAINFYNHVVKPELLSNYFTKKGSKAQVALWCICKLPDDGRPMLKCDNDDCETQWFHFNCVGLLEVPSSNWFCKKCV